jgi:hypothetical protein
MKLWLSISVTALIAVAVLAPSAGAAKPIKEPLELGIVELAAGELCPFPTVVDGTGLKATVTTFSDGHTVFHAKGTQRVTNSLSDESVSLRVAGSIADRLLPNGDLRSTARGRNVLFYLEGDVIGPGLTGPGLFLTIGRVVEIFDADTGAITSSVLSGKRIDICAQLS